MMIRRKREKVVFLVSKNIEYVNYFLLGVTRQLISTCQKKRKNQPFVVSTYLQLKSFPFKYIECSFYIAIKILSLKA